MENDKLKMKYELEGHSLGVISVAVSNNGKCKLLDLHYIFVMRMLPSIFSLYPYFYVIIVKKFIIEITG